MSDGAEYHPDVWWSRDFPVLREAVRDIDAGTGRHECAKIAAAAGLTEDEGKRAFRSLERNGHVVLHKAGGGTPIWVKDVSNGAYSAVGAYPSPDAAFDRLVAALQAQIETASPEDKPRLQKVLASIGDAGRDLVVRVIGDVIAGKVT